MNIGVTFCSVQFVLETDHVSCYWFVMWWLTGSHTELLGLWAQPHWFCGMPQWLVKNLYNISVSATI